MKKKLFLFLALALALVGCRPDASPSGLAVQLVPRGELAILTLTNASRQDLRFDDELLGHFSSHKTQLRLALIGQDGHDIRPCGIIDYSGIPSREVLAPNATRIFELSPGEIRTLYCLGKDKHYAFRLRYGQGIDEAERVLLVSNAFELPAVIGQPDLP